MVLGNDKKVLTVKYLTGNYNDNNIVTENFYVTNETIIEGD